MKTIDVYEISDLLLPENKDLLQKVCDQNRKSFIDPDWVNGLFLKEYFSILGIKLESELISFSLTGNEYCMFNSKFDLEELFIKNRESDGETFLELIPVYNAIEHLRKLDSDFTEKIMYNRYSLKGETSHNTDGIYVHVSIIAGYPELSSERRDILKFAAKEIYYELENVFIKLLKDRYNYLTSDNYILQMLTKENYVFTSDGVKLKLE